MRPLPFSLLAGIFCLCLSAQTTTVDVGSGAPTPFIQQLFQQAYYRNGFAYQVSLPPLANVKKVGTTGLVQEFSDAKNTPNVKLALVMPNQNASVVEGKTVVFQFQAGLYSYWNSLGSSTAGFPTIDSANCPALLQANACTYQLFDKPYALFVYANIVDLVGTNFFTRDPYYTKWMGYGGIGVLGPAKSAETAVTSSLNTTATVQNFDRGAIYNFTTGVLAGKQIGVKEPVWDVYVANNAHVGALGFPTSEELNMANGHKRQSFEKGSIEYDPATQIAFFRPAVAAITIIPPSNPVKLKVGETVPLKVMLVDPLGISLTDRDVLWTTTDSRVADIQSGGLTAVIRATGGGSATIRATSEGKTSTGVTVVVTSTCCQVGEGAPTTTLAKAFQDAVTRNHLNLKLPASSAVTRSGAGYIQQLESADGSGQVFWVAVPDKVLTGFVLTGRLLAAYQSLGGTTGALGYPLGDATAGGRQMFENGALAGDPVQLVTGDILTKWGVLGYEAGIAGLPTGQPQQFITFRATQGKSQTFGGAILYATAPTKVYAVTGLILARYAAGGGPTGRLGAPINDEYGINSRRKQDFEGGSIDYAPGDAGAQVTENPRQPIVTATPSAVVAGTRVRLAVGGFENDATVRVSITGQADFLVKVPAGAYVWDAFVPANTKTGSVSVRATEDSNAATSAQTTYSVRAITDVRPVLKAIAGDNQTGVPGAVLPVPLRVALLDESGNPIAGATVQFSVSPGARIESADSVTNLNGEATVRLRLPASEGIALATARASGQVVTLNARAAQSGLANFPKLSQAVDGTLGSGPGSITKKGAMLTAVAAILRYYQSRGELSASNGLADPPTLNEYLKALCVSDAAGVPVCDGFLTAGANSDPIVNLWRLDGFTGNPLDVSVDTADLSAIRDAIAQGSPVLLALALGSGQAEFGSHFVAGTGVGPDGDILIMDPNPAFGRTGLNEYLYGFATAGGQIRGRLTGVARILPRTPKSRGFLVTVNASASLTSTSGVCGNSFEFPGRVADLSIPSAQASPAARLLACDGSYPVYQLDLAGPGYEGTFTDLGTPANRIDLSGSGQVSFTVLKDSGQWTVTPAALTMAPGGIVNAASFTPDLAPGGIVAVFGTGFGTAGSKVSANVNGTDAKVLSNFPFQVNLQLPPGIAPGRAILTLSSDFGSSSQTINVSEVAPALFLVGPGAGAVINRDGALNTPSNPAKRGDVLVAFGTGFGSVSPKGTLMVADVPVAAFLEDSELPVIFAGLTPGFIGLYQVNAALPVSTPPGLNLRFSVKQGKSTSNTVEVAVQ